MSASPGSAARPVLTTPRLRGEPVTAAHQAELAALFGDPRVGEWTGGVVDKAGVAQWIADDEAHWGEHGFGNWAFFDDAGTFVGRAALLRRHVEGDTVDLSYALLPAHWGQGYGTEMAAACLAHAFGPLGLHAVAAYILPANARSRRLAESLGFRYEKEITPRGLVHAAFRVTRDAWAGAASTRAEATPMTGEVTAVSASPGHTMSKPNQPSIRLLAGLGVEGDAHQGETVKHRSRVRKDPTVPNLRQVHLMHSELFEELAAAGFTVTPGYMGENVTTRGVDLLRLPTGTRLHLGGTAIVEVTGLRNPCYQLDGLQQGLLAATLDRDADGNLVRKAGIMGVVLAGGEVAPGDPIRVALPEPPHQPLEAV